MAVAARYVIADAANAAADVVEHAGDAGADAVKFGAAARVGGGRQRGERNKHKSEADNDARLIIGKLLVDFAGGGPANDEFSFDRREDQRILSGWLLRNGRPGASIGVDAPKRAT